MPEDMNKRVSQYVQIRDKIKQIAERQAAELAPLKEIQDRLAGIIEAHLVANNTESLKTASGTCYTSVKHTASVADAEAFMTYVITTQNFDLIERRANSTAVKDYVVKNNALPPGVNMSALRTIGVRRAPGS